MEHEFLKNYVDLNKSQPDPKSNLFINRKN